MSPLRSIACGALAVLAALGLGCLGSGSAPPQVEGHELRPVASFASIEDTAERSRALFQEMSRVLTHPRCMNCHPAGDRPHQGEKAVLHNPPVTRGPAGHGVVGMRCETCHHTGNFEPGQVPGAPHWHLAPLSMAWEGLTVGEICRQIQDPSRNGNRDLDAIVKHMAQDSLVLWAWQPGSGREPAPGTAAEFAQLVAAWAETGAECP